MKDFDTKWQASAVRARQAQPREETVPLGFATRVIARFGRPASISTGLAWEHLLPRLMAGSLVVLVLCAALEAPHWRNNRPLEPGIENAVAQLLWSL